MPISVRVRGVDTAVRNLVKANEYILSDARKGIEEAAEHLMDKTVEKFGTYQPTGGEPKGYGAWKKLTFETRKRKLNKYGFMDKPLIGSGAMRDSFSVKKGGAGTLAASVRSSSPYLVHHIYGAPRANVPMRDPIRVTAKEERDECNRIINERIEKAIRRAGY